MAEEKKTRAPRKPTKVFLIYEGEGSIEVKAATKDAAEALNMIDGDRNLKFVAVTL